MKRHSHEDILAAECRIVDGGCGARSGEMCQLRRPRPSSDMYRPDFSLTFHSARVRRALALAKNGGDR